MSLILNKIIFIPGAILGMVLLLLALILKIVKLEEVEDVANFLTNNMAFFFIPAAVSVMEYFQILKIVFVKIIIICILSIFITFFVISLFLKAITIKKKGKES